jgi:hypothetical protein
MVILVQVVVVAVETNAQDGLTSRYIERESAFLIGDRWAQSRIS